MTHLHAPLLEDSAIQRQIQRETESIRQGVLKYREMVNTTTERGEASGLVPVQRLMAHWYRPMRKAVQLEQRRCFSHGNDGGEKAVGRDLYGPALRLLKAEYIATITLGNVMRDLLLETAGVKFAKVAYHIGRDILAEANLQLLKKDHRAMSSELRAVMKHMPAEQRMEYKRENQTNYELLTRMCARLSSRRVNWWAKRTLDDPVWSRRVCMSMGSCLIWHMLNVSHCGDYTALDEDGEFIPALLHERRKEKSGRKWKTVAYLSLTDECLGLIDEGHLRRETMRPQYVPMTAPPVRWEHDRGGYYRTKTPLVARTCKERADLIEASEEQMQPFFDGVDALNRVPVQINPFVLDVQKRLYQDGGGIASLPLMENPPLPPYPPNATPDQVKQTRADRAEVHKRIRGLKGERFAVAALHQLADEMVEHEAIYQVHQADFRGRCYPVQTILNHQGSDLARSLFRFSNAVPVRETGRRWMKVTMADLWGLKGLSHNQAVQAIDSAMSEIERWAHDPIANDGWTRKHDGSKNKRKAFQALAMAHALADDDAASRIPIQQDGTCNGMQHYAAMGRDEVGARAVNLNQSGPDDTPNSVYVDVAQAVLPLVEKDAASGDTLAQLILDRVTLDHACAKQVVMPAVYGMTAVGARKAMYDHLDECNITGDTRYKVSMYLGRRILNDALREVCTSTVEAMDWLRLLASLIAGKGRPVQWTTPLGFPVIQTYRNTREIKVDTIMQRVTIRIEDSDLPVRVGRQVDGFAPNFVHSIDATHLLLSAVACEKKGLDLMCVHDSYWTHAQYGDKLGEVLRQTFVSLHRQPLLELLHDQLQRKHTDIDLPEPPRPGSHDIEQTMRAFYLFS